MTAPRITADQFRTGYERNFEQLQSMLEDARAVAPRKFRGYTVAQLETRVKAYAALVSESPDHWPAIRAELAAKIAQEG